MGVYIKGMEMPTSPVLFCIHPDGKVVADLEGGWREYKAVPIPPHGRLIDAGKIYDAVEQRYRMSSGIEHRCERDFLDLICAAPAIIPAEEGEK